MKAIKRAAFYQNLAADYYRRAVAVRDTDTFEWENWMFASKCAYEQARQIMGVE